MKKWKYHPSEYSNQPRMVRYALAYLRRNEWRTIRNDKDGGFSVVHAKTLEKVEMDALSSSIYRYADRGEYRSSLRAATANAGELIDKIGHKIKDVELVRRLRRSLYRGGTITAKLDLTLKTHKDAGKVVVRCIHGQSAYCFEGLARWFVSHIRPIIAANCPYLLTNSVQAKHALSSVTIDSDCFFAKVDVKDFYLSGDTRVLVEDVMEIFDDKDSVE